MKLFAFVLFAGYLLALGGCVDHNFPNAAYDCSSQDEISYQQQIRPLIATRCAIPQCHNGALGEERNWNITDNLRSKALSVKDRITRPVGEPGHMPATGSLSQSEIQLIVCWVEQGAPNN